MFFSDCSVAMDDDVICCPEDGFHSRLTHKGCCGGWGLGQDYGCCVDRRPDGRIQHTIFNAATELCCNGGVYDMRQTTFDYCCHDDNGNPTYPYYNYEYWCYSGGIYKREVAGQVSLSKDPIENRLGKRDPSTITDERVPDHVLAEWVARRRN